MQTMLFRNQDLRIGLFRCPVDHPNFEDSGPTDGHLLVFPRTSVTITHAGGRPIVADPNVVMLYNRRQRYRRSMLSKRGDNCEWFGFNPQLVRDVIARHDPNVADRPEHLFTFAYSPSDPESYLLQRLIVEHLLRDTEPDVIFVEETVLYVLERVVDNAYRAWGTHPGHPPPTPAPTATELVHAVTALVATSFREQLTLDRIARTVYCSPYHLCRIFRQQTGSTIHHYLTQMRLRTALEYIADGHADLTTLGVELGFTSHSHFTQSFRTTFGVPPSAIRATAANRCRTQVSKILIA
jgi:AraC-like DNA-binding protein